MLLKKGKFMSKVLSLVKTGLFGGFLTTFVTSILIICFLLGSISAFLHGYVLYRYYECLVMPWFENAPKLPYAAFVCFTAVEGLVAYQITADRTNKKVNATWTTLTITLVMPVLFLFSGWVLTQLVNYFCETSLVFSL